MMDTKTLKTSVAEEERTVSGFGTDQTEQEANRRNQDISATWAEETIADLDDFIESQGIYIRQ